MRGRTSTLRTIVSVDMVHYSEDAAVDQTRASANTSALMSLCHQISLLRGGRVFKGTGDGCLLSFRSPTEAILASAFIASKAPSPIRIAIHLGEVEEDQDGDLHGAQVGVAAHLQSTATPGTVRTTIDVFRAIGAGELRSRLSPVGEVPLKGTASVEAFYLINTNGLEGPEKHRFEEAALSIASRIRRDCYKQRLDNAINAPHLSLGERLALEALAQVHFPPYQRAAAKWDLLLENMLRGESHIPLDDAKRKLIAMRAIELATNSIKAVSLANDTFFANDPRYLAANIEAKRNNPSLRIQRLVVVQGQLSTEHNAFIKQQLDAGIEVLQARVDDKATANDDEYLRRNRLIIDDVFLTRSGKSAAEKGEAVYNVRDIRKASNAFDFFWEMSAAQSGRR